MQRYGPLEDGLEDGALSVNHIEEYFTPTQLKEAARLGKPAADAPSASVQPTGQAPPHAGLTQLKALTAATNAAHQKAHATAKIASATKQAAHQAVKATSPAEDIRAFVAKQKHATAPAAKAVTAPKSKEDKMAALKAKILKDTLAKMKQKQAKPLASTPAAAAKP